MKYVLTVALALSLSACCGAPLQPDSPMYDHIGSVRYLAEPITVSSNHRNDFVKFGVHPGYEDRVLPAGTLVKITGILTTGWVSFQLIKAKKSHPQCEPYCSARVSLDPRHAPSEEDAISPTPRLVYSNFSHFDMIFAIDYPLEGVEPRSQIRAFEIEEGMSPAEVRLARGRPGEIDESADGFCLDPDMSCAEDCRQVRPGRKECDVNCAESDIQCEGEARVRWNFPGMQVYFGDDGVDAVVEGEAKDISFQRTCG